MTRLARAALLGILVLAPCADVLAQASAPSAEYLAQVGQGLTASAAGDRGAAILMSTHLLGVAERMCDRILLVDKGKLVADRRGDDVKALLAQGP
nr:hypothetical protein [Myxococcota bacterium]